jgi:hypothetical protein
MGKNKYLRVGDKLIILNGVDPLSYKDLSRKWWQLWKKRVHKYKPIK